MKIHSNMLYLKGNGKNRKKLSAHSTRLFNLSVVNKSTNIWMWTTVANKNGYILSCGTSVTDSGVVDASSEKVCGDIAQTFKIHWFIKNRGSNITPSILGF